MESKKRLGCRCISGSVFYGKILKDGSTISEKAEDIEDSNFERTMLEYLNAKMGKFKSEHYDIPITDNNRLYRIHVDVMVLDKDKEKNKEQRNGNKRTEDNFQEDGRNINKLS